jgi:hypothetical protein
MEVRPGAALAAGAPVRVSVTQSTYDAAVSVGLQSASTTLPLPVPSVVNVIALVSQELVTNWQLATGTHGSGWVASTTMPWKPRRRSVPLPRTSSVYWAFGTRPLTRWNAVPWTPA